MGNAAVSDMQSEIGSVGALSYNTSTKLHQMQSIRTFKEDKAFDEISLERDNTNDFYDATGETAAGTTKTHQNLQSFSSFSEQNLVPPGPSLDKNRSEEKSTVKPKLTSKQIMHLYRNSSYKNFMNIERNKIKT